MGVDSSAEGSSSSGRTSVVSQSAAAATSHGLHVPDLELFFPSTMSINNCSSSSKPRHSSSSASSRGRELPVFYPTTPARHSSASASAVSPNGRYGRRMMQHNSSRATTAPVAAAAVSEMLLLQQSSDVGNSFRSEDSRDRESLALWEEKGDCQSERLGRKSRWVKKLESISQVVVSNSSSTNNKQGGSRSPWRNSSSPMHQHAFTRALDSPRSSIDRKLLGPSRSPWRDLIGSSNAGRSSKANIEGGAPTHDSLFRTSSCSSPRISSVSCDVLESKSAVVAQASRLAAAAATCIEVESQERDPLELGSEFRQQKQQLDIDAAAAEKNQTNNSRRPSSAIAWDMLNKSPERSPLRAAAAVPFSWEEVPGKPKTIAAATERALARRSQSPMKTKQQKKKSRSMDESMFNESLARVHEEATAGAAVVAADHICRSPLGGSFVACAGDGGDDRSSCKSSHRFYYYRRTTSSKQDSSFDDAHSSGRLETTAGVIDLVAPAAAKFLASSWSPVSSTSPVHVSSMLKKPAAVPFKWEESPGKPFKEEELLSTTTTSVKAPQPFQLQLPPCLAPAAYQKLQQGGRGGGGSMSQQELREHCINHSMSAPLAGFYTSSAAADHQGPAERGGQHRNLPAKLFLPPVAAAVLSTSSSATTTEVAQLGRDSSSSSPQHRWSWSPVSDIGLTMITPKFMRKQQTMKKLVSQTLAGSVSSFVPTEEQQQQQQQQEQQQRPAHPRGFSSGEFTSMMMQKRTQAAAASSPTSTLHGPDTDSQLASSSLSSDLDARSSGNAANPGRMCSNSNSTASDVDSCSFECRGDFESSSSPRTSSTLHSPPHPPFVSSSSPPHDCSPPYQDLFLPNHHHPDNNPVTKHRAGAFDSRAPGDSSSPAQALIKLCKSGSRKLKFLHHQKLGTIHSPGEVWSPTPLAMYYQWKPSAVMEESEAPQKSSKAAAAATALPQQQQYLPDLQCSDLQLHHAIQKSENHDHEQYSTRLPYMMDSDIKKQRQVALAATGAVIVCNQLSPNPDFNARLGEKPFSASSCSCSNNEGSMSPAYTATLELLSPAAAAATTTTTIVARKSKKKLRMKSKVRTKWSNSAPKVQVRARFLVSFLSLTLCWTTSFTNVFLQSPS